MKRTVIHRVTRVIILRKCTPNGICNILRSVDVAFDPLKVTVTVHSACSLDFVDAASQHKRTGETWLRKGANSNDSIMPVLP